MSFQPQFVNFIHPIKHDLMLMSLNLHGFLSDMKIKAFRKFLHNVQLTYRHFKFFSTDHTMTEKCMKKYPKFIHAQAHFSSSTFSVWFVLHIRNMYVDGYK